MVLYLKAVILGIVEGVTEFLPISSTGHLILVNRFINFSGNFANMFDVVIQLGAILSVIIYFWKKLYPFSSALTTEEKSEIWQTWQKAVVGVIPALLLGKLFAEKIETHLFNPLTVTISLFVGGIILLIVERKKNTNKINSISHFSYFMVIAIGFIQCLAMIPGTSRAAATIIGAMLLGASRSVAAEYSFFLAMPTMCAASVYSLLKHGSILSKPEWIALAIGFVVSFFVAWGVIAFFMNYIRKNTFKIFAYYRIILAIIIGILLMMKTLPMA